MASLNINSPIKKRVETSKLMEKMDNLMNSRYTGKQEWERNYIQIFNLFATLKERETEGIAEPVAIKKYKDKIDSLITNFLSQESKETLETLKNRKNKTFINVYNIIRPEKPFDNLIKAAKSKSPAVVDGDGDGDRTIGSTGAGMVTSMDSSSSSGSSSGSSSSSSSSSGNDTIGSTNASMSISISENDQRLIDNIFVDGYNAEDFMEGDNPETLAKLDGMLRKIRSNDNANKDKWVQGLIKGQYIPGKITNEYMEIQKYINDNGGKRQFLNGKLGDIRDPSHSGVDSGEYLVTQGHLQENFEKNRAARMARLAAVGGVDESSGGEGDVEESLGGFIVDDESKRSSLGFGESPIPGSSMLSQRMVKSEGMLAYNTPRNPGTPAVKKEPPRRSLFPNGETKSGNSFDSSSGLSDASRNTLQEGYPKKPLKTIEEKEKEKGGPGPEDRVSTYRNFIIGDGIPGHKSNHGVKFPYRIIYGSAAERFLLTVDFRQYEAFIRMHHPEFARTTTTLSMDKQTLVRKSASLIELFGSMIGVNMLVYGPKHKNLKDCSDQYQELLMYSLGHVLNSVVGIRAGLISRRPLNKRVRTEEDIRRIQTALGPDPAVQSATPSVPSVPDAVAQEYRPAKRARSSYTENPKAFNVPTPQKMQPQVDTLFFI